MARGAYDDSPGMAQVPLTLEEVESLLLADGTYFTRDPRRVRHLLTRMRAAFGYHVQQMRNLQRDIEHMHAAARTRATPVSAALDALKNLTAAEQRQVFDIKAHALIDAVAEAEGDAERVRANAASDANRVRFVLGRVMEDADVPAEVRSRIDAALQLLPEVSEAAPAGRLGAGADRAVAEGGFSVAPKVDPVGPGKGTSHTPAPDADVAVGPALADALFGPEGS